MVISSITKISQTSEQVSGKIIMDQNYFIQPLHHMNHLVLPSYQISSTVLLLVVVVLSYSGKGDSLRAETAYILVPRRREKYDNTKITRQIGP